MPLFVIQSLDHDNVLDKRMSARPEHLARLQALDAAGRLIVADLCQLMQTIPVKVF